MEHEEEVRRVRNTSFARVPSAVFWVLPLFALLLKLLYVRRGRSYEEHLIFALHVHAFWFGCFTLSLLAIALLGALAPGGETPVAFDWSDALDQALSVALVLGLVLYTLLAMRRVYGRSWSRTLLKASVLACGYGAVLVLGLGVVIAMALIG